MLTIAPLCYSDQQSDIKDEIKLGRSIASVIAGTYGIYNNEELIKYINLVGNSVVYFNGRTELNYYFSVIDTDSINAFACPGGYIFLTKGLIMSLSNEAELASILAHEIAHVNCRHIYNAVVQKKSDSVDSILAKMIGGRNVSFSVAFNQVVNKGLEILFKSGLPYKDEYEADAAAVFYLENTGYSSFAYKEVLTRFAGIDSLGNEKFSSTHPPMKERITKINDLLNGEVENGEYLRERFQSHISRKI